MADNKDNRDNRDNTDSSNANKREEYVIQERYKPERGLNVEGPPIQPPKKDDTSDNRGKGGEDQEK